MPARAAQVGLAAATPASDSTGWIGIADIADVCGAHLGPPAA